MRGKYFTCSLVTLFCVIAVMIVPAAMAEYPDKPIEFVVHSSPGGGSDLFARTVAHILEKEGLVKVKINVKNRRGGSGTKALDFLHSKEGDPYVLMQVTTSPLSAILRGSSKMKLDDLTFIARVVIDPNLAFTRYDSPYNDMKSLMEYAKKNPSVVSVAYGNVGGSEHICAHRVAKAVGAKLNPISFGGGAGAAVAILGGHVSMGFGNVNEQMGQIEAKKVKALGTMTPERLPFMPDVPTMREQGIDAVYTQIRGFWAPKNFPDYARDFWEETLYKLTKTKGFKDYLKTSYGVNAFLRHDEFKAFIVDYLKELKIDVDELGAYKKKK